MLKIEKHAKSFNINPVSISKYHTQYVIEPLYRGYGHTVGNALRRVLLSSIPGAAIKGLRIDGVLSEFSVIEGVKEAVTDIVLNVKEIVIKTEEHGEKTMTLSVKGPKEVKASDIIPDMGLEIINPDQTICTITSDKEINMEFIVGTGEGFVTSEDIDRKGWAVGFMAVDAIYTPIKKVSYSVQDTMVGRMTDFDKLTIDIETDGSVNTSDAISYAVELLSFHLNPFLEIGNKLENLRDEEIEEEEETGDAKSDMINDELKIEELDLTVRSFNCLKKAEIDTIGQLAKMSTTTLMRIKNLGKKSYEEILEKMRAIGIDLSKNNENEAEEE